MILGQEDLLENMRSQAELQGTNT